MNWKMLWKVVSAIATGALAVISVIEGQKKKDPGDAVPQ